MPRLPHFLAALTAAAAVSAAPAGADMAADVASALQLPGVAAELDSAFAAEAAFIRRNKIKRKYVAPYKVVVVTSEAPGDTPISTVSVDFPSTAGGETPPPQQMTTPRRRKAHFKGMLTQWPATYSFTIEFDDGTAVTAPVEGLEPTVAGSETLVTLEGGYKARLRMTANLQVKAIVLNDDRDWDPSVIANVRVGDDTNYLDIPAQYVTSRWVASGPDSELPADLQDGSSYVMEITAADAAGNTVAYAVRSEVLGDTPTDAPAIDKTKLKVKNNGDVKVTTFTEGFDGQENSLQTVVTDDAGNVLVSSLDDMPTGVARTYDMQTLTFDDPAAAADEVYSVVIDVKDSTGASLGSADAEVVVQGLVDLPDSIVGLTAATTLYATSFNINVGGEDAGGMITISQLDATNFFLGVMLTTDQGASVEVNIVPTSGPTPEPENLEMAPVSEHKAFVTVGNAGAGTLEGGGAATIEQVLVGAEDQALDVFTTTTGAGVWVNAGSTSTSAIRSKWRKIWKPYWKSRF